MARNNTWIWTMLVIALLMFSWRRRSPRPAT